jgi:hypothetical protein
MKLLLKFIIVLFLTPCISLSQTDSIGKVKYTSDFVFNDGVYKSFSEFKADSPSIKQFTIKNPSPYADPNYTILEYTCPDSVKTPGGCNLKDVWGYAYHGDVYIAHSYYAYYFKLMVVGSLCHFVGLAGFGTYVPANDVMMGFGADNNYQQYMLNFETGEVFTFNYKNFSLFLKVHDSELYQELMKQKKKKKIIFKYLLKYNERHPIWF